MQENPYKQGSPNDSDISRLLGIYTDQETPIDRELIFTSFNQVREFNRENSTINAIERIFDEFAKGYIEYHSPELEASAKAAEEKATKKRLISDFHEAVIQNNKIVSIFFPDEMTCLLLDNSIEHDREEQKQKAESVVFLNAFSLSQIGLSINLEDSNVDIELLTSNTHYYSETLEFNLQDGKKYISFLSQLEKDDLKKSELKTHLGSIASSLTRQLIWYYTLSPPNKETSELLANLGRIIKEYQRLGQFKFVTNLNKAYKKREEGILEEYVVALKRDLILDTKTETGPGFWFQFYDPDEFKDRWQVALSTLKAIRVDPRANEFFNELKSGFFTSINLSLTKIDESDSLDKDIKDSYTAILYTIEKTLEDPSF